MPGMRINLPRLRERLAASKTSSAGTAVARRAAVLVPLQLVEQQWHLLFIRRAEVAGDVHSGQVAFPGGHLEAGESTQQAALREAEEEIALQAADVESIGALPDFVSITDVCVTPQLALLPWPYPFRLQTQEVSRVFTVPLAWLADPSHFYTRIRVVNDCPRQVIYYQPYQGETLWGLTAAITHSLLVVLNELD